MKIFWQLYLLKDCRILNKSVPAQLLALDWSKAFDMVWLIGLHHKLHRYRIWNLVFGFIFLFLSNSKPQMVLHGKILQEYSRSVRNFQGSTISSTFFLLHINYLSSIVRKIVSEPPPLPFFRNLHLPPLDPHHGKIIDSMMIHWNQGDWKQLI